MPRFLRINLIVASFVLAENDFDVVRREVLLDEVVVVDVSGEVSFAVAWLVILFFPLILCGIVLKSPLLDHCMVSESSIFRSGPIGSPSD